MKNLSVSFRHTMLDFMSDNNYKKTADIIFGRWKSQVLYAGVRLGIFDYATSHVKSTADIANELGLDAKLAYRLLRALSSMGLLKVFSIRLLFHI
jgi:methyltransferase family protein